MRPEDAPLQKAVSLLTRDGQHTFVSRDEETGAVWIRLILPDYILDDMDVDEITMTIRPGSHVGES